jgi:hypothetical protein
MKHVYQNKLEDLIYFASEADIEFRNYQRSRGVLIFPLIFLFMLVFYIFKNIYVIIISGSILVFLFYILSKLKYAPSDHYSKELKEKLGEDYFKEYKITLSDDYISIECESHTDRIGWNEVKKVENSGSHIFVYTSSTSAVIIPSKSFPSVKYYEAFLNTIKSLRKEFYKKYNIKRGLKDFLGS